MLGFQFKYRSWFFLHNHREKKCRKIRIFFNPYLPFEYASIASSCYCVFKHYNLVNHSRLTILRISLYLLRCVYPISSLPLKVYLSRLCTFVWNFNNAPPFILTASLVCGCHVSLDLWTQKKNEFNMQFYFYHHYVTYHYKNYWVFKNQNYGDFVGIMKHYILGYLFTWNNKLYFFWQIYLPYTDIIPVNITVWYCKHLPNKEIRRTNDTSSCKNHLVNTNICLSLKHTPIHA